ncbi:MAG: hypothetical protein NZZ41_06690 [Candidatus Dojkabacteria bacterium]|nr:hypothetical protein [Candidatus Dojkabacteria bacterium]
MAEKNTQTNQPNVEEIVVQILELWSMLPQDASIELLGMLNKQFLDETQSMSQTG